jgi:carbonic anhydrase
MHAKKYFIFPVLLSALLACKPRVEQSEVKDGGVATAHSTAPLYNVQENWPDTCKSGSRQSPIALSTSYIAQIARSSTLKFNFAPVDTKVIDDGHSIKASVTSGLSSLTLDTVDFDLLQFHFHETSEHSLNNEMFDGEMHFVHKERGGNGLLALGLFLKETKDSAQSGLEDFFAKLPINQQAGHSGGHAEKELLPSTRVDPASIVKSGLNYIVYNGSLTTPPCTESVTHMVATEPVEVSTKTLAKLRAFHNKTNRKIQILNSDEIRDFRTTRR